MWIYKNKKIEEIPKGYYGFVYIITDIETNRKYIGKKSIFFRRRKKNKLITFESDWKDYFGSSEELKSLIEKKVKDFFKR